MEFDENKFYCKDVFGHLLENILPLFTKIFLCAPVTTHSNSSVSFCHYCIENNRISVQRLPGYGSTILYAIYHKLISSIYICIYAKKWDIMYIYMPSFIGVAAYFINALFFRKPYVIYLGASWSDIAKFSWPQGHFTGRTTFPFYYKISGYLEKKIICKSPLVLVAGRKLKNQYINEAIGRVVEAVPEINISLNDLYIRDDIPTNNIKNILYVGTVNPWKGLEYLIKAIACLSMKLKLTIVGSANNNKYRDVLKNLIKNYGLEKQISFTGYIPNGPKLWKIYRKNGIFVLPSLAEGFPRVLYEAMSQGLVVITTNVGGVEFLLKNEHNALIVPPYSSEAISSNIQRIINDDLLRKRIIANGYNTVKSILSLDLRIQLHQLLVQTYPAYRKYQRDRKI